MHGGIGDILRSNLKPRKREAEQIGRRSLRKDEDGFNLIKSDALNEVFERFSRSRRDGS